MKRTTHREYLTWMAYFELELDRPSRSDNYLMQIACEVRRTRAETPSAVKLQDFKLQFEQQEQGAVSEEELIRRSQGSWKALMRMPVRVVERR